MRAYTLKEVLDAARADKRIEPGPEGSDMTIYLSGEINSEKSWLDEGKLEGVFAHAAFDYGVNFTIVGGGAGCVRIMVRVEDIPKLHQMVTDPKFLKLASEAKIDSLWMDSPHFVIETANSGEAAPPLVDFGVITPLLEEFMVVHRVLRANSTSVSKLACGAYTFYRYDIVSNSGEVLRVAATFMPRMGNDVSALTTCALIQTWRPKYLVLTGIAGGIHESLTLGDVIIADEICRYDRRRKETEEETKWAPSGYSSNRVLFNRACALLLEEDLLDAWRSECLLGYTGMADPSVIPANVACGDAVVDGEFHKSEIKDVNRSCMAIEMEAGGFMEAAMAHDHVGTLVLRGISDRASNKAQTDGDSHMNWRAYCMNNVAAFLLMFLRDFSLSGGELVDAGELTL